MLLGHLYECPGRRPQDSFPLPVRLFRGWVVHLQPLPTPVCIREQKFLKARPLSAPTARRGSFVQRCAWVRAVASEKGQSGGPVAELFIHFCVQTLHLCIRSFFLICAFINSSMSHSFMCVSDSSFHSYAHSFSGEAIHSFTCSLIHLYTR